MQLRTADSSSFISVLKMETEYLLQGTLLLVLLSGSIYGQSQQPLQSKLLPNLFSTIQASLVGFNRFSYVPRPVSSFPAAGYRPSEVNFAYPHPFVQPVIQQPVIHFTGPARTRQKLPLPTLPPMRDEPRQQLPPKHSSNTDTGNSPQKPPSMQPSLTMLPQSPDNRHFHDVRFIQPPSIAPLENSRKEIPLEKFHKPVLIDPAFGSDNARKSIASPFAASSNSDSALVRLKNPQAPYSAEKSTTNAKHYNASGHPAQRTRISSHINKQRRPFDNFKPITIHSKPFSREKPVLPQLTENHNQPSEIPKSRNTVKLPDEKLPDSTLMRESNTSLLPSSSISHSIYVKPSDESNQRPTILKEEKEAYTISNEPSSPTSLPKEDTQSVTQKPERASDTSAESDPSEFAEENVPANTVTEAPLPPRDHLASETITPPETKSVVAPSEVDGRGEAFAMSSSWGLGDNNMLTGTPEEILTLKLADAINNFGFELYRKMQKMKNVFFSPLSLSAALAIVLEGTSNMTALQMMNGLHFSESNIRPDEVKAGYKRLMKSLKNKRSDYQFENANLLLLQNKFFFKSEFSNTVYRHYKPLLGSVDFAANGLNIKRNVNDWVKRRTHGKIEEFLTERLPPETVFVVLNAVYFRGQWTQPFDSILTGPALFYNFGKDPVEVTMMKQIGNFPIGYSANLNSQVIELPYEGEETSMVILLPEERDGIYELRNQLNYQELYVILSAIDFQLVQLSLPRFSLQSRYDMEDILKEMGMKDVFIPGKANFGRMTNVTGLYLSKVSHEGVIDVDEKGTEAAASTGGFVVPLSRPRAVIVDHPFFFFIRNRSNGAILFIGQFDAFHV